MDARTMLKLSCGLLPQKNRGKWIKPLTICLSLAISSAAYSGVDNLTGWQQEYNFSSSQQSQKHIVQPGETLSEIADMYDVPTALLSHHNGIPDPEDLMIGQVIHLPDNQYPTELLQSLPAPAAGEIPQSNMMEMAPAESPVTMPAPVMPEMSNFQAMEPVKEKDFGSRPYAYFGNSEPVSDVIRNFASNYAIPVIISEAVEGVVNGRIGPLSPVEFLDKIAQLNNLIWYFDGNTLYVYNSNEIEKQIINLQYLSAEDFRKTLMEIGIWDSRFYWRSRPAEGIIYLSGPPRYMELVTQTASLLDAKAGLRQKSQLTVKVFPLRYAWADDRTFNFRNQNVTVPGVATVLRQIVQGGGISAPAQAQGRSLQGLDGAAPAGSQAQPPAPAQAQAHSESVFINADRRLNAVIIHDLESKMSMYESLINTLDKPLAQVEINVSIIDINTNNLDQLGVNWKLGKSDKDYIRFNPFSGQSANDISNSFSTIINITSGKLMSQVNLLSESGNAKILARPSVLTLDNMEAVLDNSQTFYVKVAGQDAAELFPVTYGSVLKVTPRIVDEVTGRKLHLSVNIQDGAQASNAQGADDIPVVKNSSISTQAVIDENESLLVGGYYYEETTKSIDKIPVLGDMPIVGAAFRNKKDDRKKNVRLFLITPRIVSLM
ncbi:type III secretion system outer membrane ring subunit SctC [Sansalvadorimonas sp. 2012CJ34-2]|uniref:Type 3 secretion system secretin n=1 Tax=Parendozoicomonas callyspongiae TaxID=2942213 RepID=A0ABT0PGR0_9GAMM|nr:type III secretion system outer membrane ring subunit SctC [Sansalvadorimonas sp. 2012CJ34-2]MCL6270555.1 type III secretion system outer membrane ring subunit SctC [Sansalvadorimonas sp. 2012CJ34-2]